MKKFIIDVNNVRKFKVEAIYDDRYKEGIEDDTEKETNEEVQRNDFRREVVDVG